MDDSSSLLVEYLRRSYHAVDGLWFMKAEEAVGFDAALQLDQRVWEVLAKIQARKARELLGVKGNSLAEFARCFSLGLRADGYTFEQETAEQEVRFTITGCPWLELLYRSGRQELAAPIAEVLCPTEARVWCQEFGREVEADLPAMACLGAGQCQVVFHQSRAVLK